jgi:iron complex transport system substrate-binding protein
MRNRPVGGLFVAAFIGFIGGLWTPLSAQPESGAVTLRYATGFRVECRADCKVVTVTKPWPGSRDSFVYVLYPRGKARPSYAGKALYVQTPVRRVVSYSSTYIPEIAAAGGLSSIVGVDNAAYIYSPELRARLASGQVVETTRNGNPNMELLLSLGPDAVFTYGVGNEWDTYPKMLELGLPVVIDGEWNETDPLARAEWMKFIALFYDAEDGAETLFSSVEAGYLRLKAEAAKARTKPRVLVNAPFQGSWTVSGGKSYMARFIADAGGDYLWAQDGSTGGLSLGLEAVYERGLAADIWLNPGAAASLKELLSMDARFAGLPAFGRGAVWGTRLRATKEGANDYFESGVMRPDLVLADLVRIFHPELAPLVGRTLGKQELGGDFRYYARLR